MEIEFTNKFSSTLCDCCAGDDGCKTCCLSYLLPGVQYGLNVERLDKQSGAWFAGDFIASCGVFYGASVLGSLIGALGGFLSAGVFIVPPLHIFPMMNARKAIRQKYRIQGNSLGDLCTVLWCTPCVLCQEHRQLKFPAPGDTVSGIPVHMPMPVTTGEYMAVPMSEDFMNAPLMKPVV